MTTSQNIHSEREEHNSLNRIAERLNEIDGQLRSETWHSGGGNFGVLLQLGGGREAFWGVADGIWGVDVWESGGDVDSIEIELKGDDPDVSKVAATLLTVSARYKIE